MENTKIAKAKREEKEAILKCARRVLAYGEDSSLSSRINEASIEEDIENGDLRILKQNKRVLGAIKAVSNWGDRLFKDGRNYKKEMDVLDGFAYEGERIVYVDYLFVDPSFNRKKLGTSLMQTLFHHYEESSFLLLLTEKDCLAFFRAMGFYKAHIDEDLGFAIEKGRLYVRPIQKTGLCSQPLF